MEFANKCFLILGAGISGRSVASVLSTQGAQVILNDAKKIDENRPEFQLLAATGIRLITGIQDESLLSAVDYIVVSPGISINIPLLDSARSKGIMVMSEVEVAYRLCKVPIIAITGTNGKTTTTTLTGEMVKASGRDTVVGGNIGMALSHEVQVVSDTGIVVAEISSFQLEGTIDFRPKIAAVLNLTPDHIDRHGSFAGYQEAKERIFANQATSDYLILNYDDEAVRSMAERANAQVLFFSMETEQQNGAFVKDGMIRIHWQDTSYSVCAVEDLKLLGKHNVENALAACCAALLVGVSPETMAKTLTSFTGVEHRIEPVKIIAGVTYYNDSKATNPESSVKALEAFPGNIILIAGGRDKLTDLSEFMMLIKSKVDHLILLGEAKQRFYLVAQEYGMTAIHCVSSMAEAVKLAHKLAHPPQVVVLSPACASYDMFANYEERGRVFKKLVNRLG